MKQALSTIYSEHHRLLTPEGLWNILTFRGATYGSPYAENDLQWFDTYEEWTDYYAASNKTFKGDKTQYFINVAAYGMRNKHRNINNIAKYWDERHRWTSFIASKPDLKKTYKFLTQNHKGESQKKVFPNIGPLTALLVCGDLIELKILEIPAIKDWAELIYDVQKGATLGLHSLALIGETFTKEDVIDAFTKLDSFLVQELSDDDKLLMGYNMVMLEHGLCKFTRILTKAEKVSTHWKKPSTTRKAS